MDQKREKALARFMDKIEVDPATGCWELRGFTARGGYAAFYLDGRRRAVRAARFLYETTEGEIPPGYEIHHECFNRRCCRIHPDHCTVTTHAENVRLSAERGSWTGERNGMARLSNEEAETLRKLHAGQPEMFSPARLAEVFGVCVRTAYNVLSRTTYSSAGESITMTV
jgi:hypothetical protein